MKKPYNTQYHIQKSHSRIRNIEWHFTYATWITWWGEDIIRRGKYTGQLVMARLNDMGPYHPDNVRKATVNENCSEGNTGKPISAETRAKISASLSGRKGHPVSDEIREKISASHKARHQKRDTACNPEP